MYLVNSDGMPFVWPPEGRALPADAGAFVDEYLARDVSCHVPERHVTTHPTDCMVVHVIPHRAPEIVYYAVVVERFAARD